MRNDDNRYGLVGRKAPELEVAHWVDESGQTSDSIKLADYRGKFKVIYCFQSWCPGCHSNGLPSLQTMVDAFKGDDRVVFLAIQTVFEGWEANTYEKMLEVQQRYDLKIPFGHDAGDENTRNIARTMVNYRTGGTPWFIFINESDQVVFNDFHLNADKTVEYLKQALVSPEVA